MAPQLVRARIAYKDIRIRSFYHTHTHTHTHTRTNTHTNLLSLGENARGKASCGANGDLTKVGLTHW